MLTFAELVNRLESGIYPSTDDYKNLNEYLAYVTPKRIDGLLRTLDLNKVHLAYMNAIFRYTFNFKNRLTEYESTLDSVIKIAKRDGVNLKLFIGLRPNIELFKKYHKLFRMKF